MNGIIDTSDDDLRIFWDCNEGGGEWLTDSSGNNNNALLYGGQQWDSDVPLTSSGMAPAPMIITTVSTDSCPEGEWMVGFEC